MNRDEYIVALTRFVSIDVVKGYQQQSPTELICEVHTAREYGRTQLLKVLLSDDEKHVVAYSFIGDLPSNVGLLHRLLEENRDGSYSRIAALNDQLVQTYRYPLEELEPVEMAKGLHECAMFADIYEAKYFGGDAN